jgi:hypothetical protein
MVEVCAEGTASRTQSISRCAICGNLPGGGMEVGGGKALGWLECRPCGRRTAGDQTFEQAREQWNRWQEELGVLRPV